MNDSTAATTAKRARHYIREGLLETDPDTQQLSVALYRLLASGVAVTRPKLAEVLDLAPARLEELIAAHPSSTVDVDADGTIVAFGGLTLEQTAHEFEVGGRMLHTWCVLDALFLPQIIAAPGILRTQCPATGAAIEVQLDPTRIISHRPDGVVMSIVGPDKQACRDNIRGAFCQHVLLFRDEAAFGDWSRDRADVAFVSLDEAHALGVERNASRYPDIVF